MKCGGEGAREIQRIWLGNGIPILVTDATEPQEATAREKSIPLPLKLSSQRITCQLRKYGADATVKFRPFSVDVQAGIRMALFSRDGGKNAGITPFVRLELYKKIAWLEGGALAYSLQQGTEAGDGYIMAYFDPRSLIDRFGQQLHHY